MYVSVIVMIPFVVIGSIIMVFSPLIVEDLFRLHGDMISKVSIKFLYSLYSDFTDFCFIFLNRLLYT